MSVRRSASSRFAVPVVTFALLGLLGACGGDETGEPSGRTSSTSETDTTETSGSLTTAPPTAGQPSDDLMPTADPSTYVGRNRVANLLVLPDGTTPAIDVWARRSFEYAPILLAESLTYGSVTDWYGAPEGMSVAAMPAGAGPDAEPLTSVFSADADQQYTHLVMYDRESGAAGGFLLEDIDPTTPNGFPAALADTGLVQLYAYQLKLHPLAEGESFDLTLGGRPVDFQVGIEGTPGCAPQPRMTDQGFAPNILGGTQRVPFDLPPGDTVLTFHGWGSTNEDCLDPSVIEPITVSVTAGSRQWVVLHSADGETIEALTLPID